MLAAMWTVDQHATRDMMAQQCRLAIERGIHVPPDCLDMGRPEGD